MNRRRPLMYTAVVKNFRQLCQLCGSMRAKAKNIIKTSNLLLHVEVSQNRSRGLAPDA